MRDARPTTRADIYRRIQTAKRDLFPAMKGKKMEIGLRVRQHDLYFDMIIPTYEDTLLADDDLDDFFTVDTLPEEYLKRGMVAHLYFYRPIGRGEYELDSTKTVWLGDNDHSPMVVHDDAWNGKLPFGTFAGEVR